MSGTVHVMTKCENRLDGLLPNTELDRVRPSSLTFDITHRCNFNCPECIEREGMRYSRHTDLLLSTVCCLISQFADQGGQEVRLYGGEPTVHKHFGTIVRHAAKCVDFIRVVTNGSLLKSPSVSEALKAASETAKLSVRVSLNAGMPQTHERLHRVSGFFPEVLKGIESLSSSGIQLGVGYLVEEANANEVFRAYEITRECGATDFWLRPKTGLHGIGLAPMSLAARQAVLESIAKLMQCDQVTDPKLHLQSWFPSFLEAELLPDTAKSYPACYYCAASRLVITPPDPGVVWACTYWRAHPRFHVANQHSLTYCVSFLEIA